ncbi:MAG: PTS sugar transporter subunit IIC [Syntrophales bacterium]|nr:PTS sugar transporter subunit IIC [Syntrophales bacterium]
MSDILILTFASALVGLDHLCLKTMLSRPVFVSPLIGLLWGDVKLGLQVGAWLELIWIDKVPVGNYVPPTASYLSVIIVGSMLLAGLGGKHTHLYLMGSLVFLLPLAYLGKELDMWFCRRNETNARRAELAATEGQIGRVKKEHLFALIRGVTVASIFMVGAALGWAFILGMLISYAPPFAYRAADFMFHFFPPILLGHALHRAYTKGDGKLIFITGLLGGVACVLIYGSGF